MNLNWGKGEGGIFYLKREPPRMKRELEEEGQPNIDWSLFWKQDRERKRNKRITP